MGRRPKEIDPVLAVVGAAARRERDVGRLLAGLSLSANSARRSGAQPPLQLGARLCRDEVPADLPLAWLLQWAREVLLLSRVRISGQRIVDHRYV